MHLPTGLMQSTQTAFMVIPERCLSLPLNLSLVDLQTEVAQPLLIRMFCLVRISASSMLIWFCMADLFPTTHRLVLGSTTQDFYPWPDLKLIPSHR